MPPSLNTFCSLRTPKIMSHSQQATCKTLRLPHPGSSTPLSSVPGPVHHPLATACAFRSNRLNRLNRAKLTLQLSCAAQQQQQQQRGASDRRRTVPHASIPQQQEHQQQAEEEEEEGSSTSSPSAGDSSGTSSPTPLSPSSASPAASPAPPASTANLNSTQPLEPASLGSSTSPALSPGLEAVYRGQREWAWRGHRVNYSVLGRSRFQGDASAAVVMVHGFGASIGHWRKTMPLLAEDSLCRVYALDLLGLGASDKPQGFPYSIEAWAQMVDDFAAQVVEEKQVVFIGNSIGSLITLAAAAGACSGTAGLAGRVKGVVLLNCAGGLNNKAILDDWRIKLFLPLFLLIDFLLSLPPVASGIFNRVKSKENVRSALRAVYCNQDAVDDELVELVSRPADDEGALEAFVAVITGPPGPRPEVLMAQITCPILILWGEKDPFTPLDGPVGKYFRDLPTSRPSTTFVVLEDVGHCPQDDREALVHDALLPWLEALFSAA